MLTDKRLSLLHRWVKKSLNIQTYRLEPLKNDASFRRYFRLHEGKQTYIIMDSPPETENNTSYIAIDKELEKLGIIVPKIFAQELEQGFLLLSDLGNELFLDALKTQNPDPLYQQAIETLLSMQRCQSVTGWALPCFDEEHTKKELELFWVWFLQKHLKIQLTVSEHQLLSATYTLIITQVQIQPYLFIHRDYHSRNLIISAKRQLGVLDFQDAMRGPITYDIVSLLRDCYINWPSEKVHTWALSYWKQAVIEKRIPPCSVEQFLAWFDWMGIQRHLKAIGIFARLHIRDKKAAYLDDIPRTLSYVLETAKIYPELEGFVQLLEQKILPRLVNKS